MDERAIRVTLTAAEFVALRRTVTGELESLTEMDWESGAFQDLDRASVAMNIAWHRYQRRLAKAVA